MPQFDQHFTLAEARRLLPWIRSVLEKIHWTLESLREAPGMPGASPPETDTSVPAAPPGPPLAGESPFDRPKELIAGLPLREKRALAEGLVKAILERGVVIQDVHRGLIDFPAWKDGREVLLCYEPADGPDIRYWHDIHAGYAGRRSVADEDWE